MPQSCLIDFVMASAAWPSPVFNREIATPFGLAMTHALKSVRVKLRDYKFFLNAELLNEGLADILL